MDSMKKEEQIARQKELIKDKQSEKLNKELHEALTQAEEKDKAARLLEVYRTCTIFASKRMYVHL